jgi:hypothetical protein
MFYVYVVLRPPARPPTKQYRKISRILYTPMSPSTSAATSTTIVIVSKTGTLSECVVQPSKETTIDELTILLSKKCGYRNHDGFSCYHTWRYKNKHKYSFHTGGGGGDATVPKYIYVDLWTKTDGRAGQENKYELPPPIDELLVFGNMALVARIDKETAVNLTIELWTKIYEKLFGGFEDLSLTVAEDENEIDELDAIPDCKKTSNGYLKDGFVVEDDMDETPRCKRVTRGRGGGSGKKPKSESTEGEFVTETETESETPVTNSSDGDGDGEVEPIPVNKIVSKKAAAAAAAAKPPKKSEKKQGGGKSKKVVEEKEVEPELESESELSEDAYD